MDVQEVQAMLLIILGFMLLLATLQPLLDNGTFPFSIGNVILRALDSRWSDSQNALARIRFQSPKTYTPSLQPTALVIRNALRFETCTATNKFS